MCVFFFQIFSKVLLIGHWFISTKRLTAWWRRVRRREMWKKMHLAVFIFVQFLTQSLYLSPCLLPPLSLSLAHTTPAAIDGFILEMYLLFVALCATHGTTCASIEWEKIGKIGKRENQQMKQKKVQRLSPLREQRRAKMRRYSIRMCP